MSDEVRDMIKSALADEPPSGLEFERVVADGRRRRVRRRYGALTATAAGIVAVVGVTVLVSGMVGRPSSPAAGQSTAVPTTAQTPAQTTAQTTAPAHPGCVVPAMTGGFLDLPRGTASPEELAESGRLTEAFKQFTLPLPAGVEATPVELCVVKESWGGSFELTGDRSVFVYVRPRGGQPPGECVVYGPDVRCSTRTLPDGSTARVTLEPGETTLVSADVWRADGTYVRVMETGGLGSTNRVFGDDQLVAIAAAPQLRVQWTVATPVLPGPSDRRAGELDAVLAAALPTGFRVEPGPGDPADKALRFRVSQGGYKAMAILSDAAGSGWVFINLNPPAEKSGMGCGDRVECELVDLSDGRRAAVTTETSGGVTRISLAVKAADGTFIAVDSTNAADTGTGTNTPTRPTPPLGVADLVRIAELADLHW